MIIYEDILKAFNKKRVKYVLVGGIAVNLLGSLRTTSDMDILVEMSDENLAKIVKILKAEGYKVKQPVDPMGIANAALRHDWIHNKNMKAFNFYKDEEFKEVDLIIETPVSYETAKKTAVYVSCGRMRLPVISIDNLIKMKRKSGRAIDNADIGELKELKKLEGR